MNIELLAVNKVNDALLYCPHLEPAIDSLDRIAFTDGHIDLHSETGQHTNQNFVGRVSVQVKGKTVSNLDSYKRTFSIETAALKAYAGTGGVLYFVVFMGKRGQSASAHYRILTPFFIEELLRGTKPKQKSKTVQLRKLPSRTEEIEQIVKLALQAQNERPGSSLDRALLNQITEFTLHTDGSVNFDSPVALNRLETDFSVSFKTAGNMVGSLDGDFNIVPMEYVDHPLEASVKSGEFQFHKPFIKRISEDLTRLTISSNLTISIPDGRHTGKGSISVTTSPILEDRYQDIGFFISCIDNGQLQIGSRTSLVSFAPIDDGDRLRVHFEFLRRVRELVLHLNSDPSLVNLDEISLDQSRQLTNIYSMMVEGHENQQNFTQPVRLKQSVGGWTFELIFLKGDLPETWKCVDLFSEDLKQNFIARNLESPPGNPEFVRITAYDLLEVEEIASALNLNLSRITDAYEHLADYPESRAQANLTMLKFIHAAGLKTERRPEFLLAAETLNDWLIGIEGELPIHVINRAQIEIRSRALPDALRTAIRGIRRQASRDELDNPRMMEVACAILLGDRAEIDECVQRLNPAKLAEMKMWPIWELQKSFTD